MDNLPTEVLRKILNRLPEEELAGLKQVCKSWRDVIDSDIGIPLHLGSGNECYWLDGVQWNPLNAISEVGISRAFFSEIQEEIPPLGFKYPQLVKEISFDGFVAGSSFSKLIAQLPNLQIVKIHTSTLCYLRSIYLKEWNLPSLKDLHIVSYGTDGQDSWSHMNDQIIDSTDIILRSNRFPSLRHLYINMLFIPTREKELTDAILECVFQHKGTLRSLLMEYKYEGDSNEPGISLTSCEPEDSTKWLLKLSGLQLDKFSLQFYYDGAPRSDFWKRFLTSQRGLCSIDYICGHGLIPFPTALILQNQSTLVQIHLKVNVEEENFDCTVFEECRLLKTLGLVNKSSEIILEYDGDEFDINETKYPLLRNPTKLPSSLKNLLIGYFKIKAIDSHYIAFKLPNLEELCFSVIGVSDNYGLEMEDLMTLLEEKRLKRITILDGINEKSLEKYDRGDPGSVTFDDPTFVLSRLILRLCDPNIDCYLTADGHYDSPECLLL